LLVSIAGVQAREWFGIRADQPAKGRVGNRRCRASTYGAILNGGPSDTKNGVVFGNRERLLPQGSEDYRVHGRNARLA
jgi:guanyl-specific ribonuclease Sa